MALCAGGCPDVVFSVVRLRDSPKIRDVGSRRPLFDQPEDFPHRLRCHRGRDWDPRALRACGRQTGAGTSRPCAKPADAERQPDWKAVCQRRGNSVVAAACAFHRPCRGRCGHDCFACPCSHARGFLRGDLSGVERSRNSAGSHRGSRRAGQSRCAAPAARDLRCNAAARRPRKHQVRQSKKRGGAEGRPRRPLYPQRRTGPCRLRRSCRGEVRPQQGVEGRIAIVLVVRPPQAQASYSVTAVAFRRGRPISPQAPPHRGGRSARCCRAIGRRRACEAQRRARSSWLSRCGRSDRKTRCRGRRRRTSRRPPA
jgi:hypothetical protein